MDGQRNINTEKSNGDAVSGLRRPYADERRRIQPIKNAEHQSQLVTYIYIYGASQPELITLFDLSTSTHL